MPPSQHKEIDVTFDVELWPTGVNIKKDHLPIQGYLTIKF